MPSEEQVLNPLNRNKGALNPRVSHLINQLINDSHHWRVSLDYSCFEGELLTCFHKHGSLFQPIDPSCIFQASLI